jgi:hypothetical protein
LCDDYTEEEQAFHIFVCTHVMRGSSDQIVARVDLALKRLGKISHAQRFDSDDEHGSFLTVPKAKAVYCAVRVCPSEVQQRVSGFGMHFMAGKPRGRGEMMLVGLTKKLLHDETCPVIWRGGGNRVRTAMSS